MNIKDIQREKRSEGKREQPINIRISKAHSDFMKENNISPTKLFIKALEEIMKNKS